MSTRSTIQFEHDEAPGREMHLYRDLEEPGFVLLEVVGVSFEIEGPVHLKTAYPSSLILSLAKEQARRYGFSEDSFEVHGAPARITLKIPDAWALTLGLIEDKAQRSTMAELLKDSDYSQPQPSTEREWIDPPPAEDETLKTPDLLNLA
jgi:hypothetical protein